MSALDVARRADALVQLMRSDAPLEQARAFLDGTSDEDRPAIARAFAARGWEDGGEPVPDRGARIRDWLAGTRDGP